MVYLTGKTKNEGDPALPGRRQMFLDYTGALIGVDETPTSGQNTDMLGNRQRAHTKQNDVAGVGV